MINKTNIKQWWYLRLLVIVSLTLWQIVGLNRNHAFAQNNIVPDDTLGNEKSRVVPFDGNNAIDTIRGGAVRGSNLFHSFQEFNIGTENEAYFYSPNAAIQNILARVTGRNPSEILGILGTRVFDGSSITNSNANLFLINPNGIVFGENARLDVGGSFVATTADGIQFGELGVFSAINPQFPQILNVNPSALFFNQVAAQSIVSKSRATNLTQPSFIDGLRVPDGNSLMLLGGNITLDGGFLNALGGKIELGGLAKPGTVNLNIDGNNLDATFPDNVEYSDISLQNQAAIITSGIGGGEIKIQGNNVTVTGNSNISSFNNGDRDGKGINIKATQLDIFGASNIQTGATSTGNSGDISIETKNLNLQDRVQIASITFAAGGNASNIAVRANDIKLNNSRIGSVSVGRGSEIGTGSAGNISIEAKTLDLENSGLVLNSFLGQGNAGNLNLDVTESINLTRSSVSTSSFSTGLGGDIDISTKNLNLSNGSLIGTSNFDPTRFDPELLLDPVHITFFQEFVGTVEPGNTVKFGEENSGNVTINASESVTLTGVSANGQTRTSIFTSTLSNGAAGNVTIETEKLNILDGAAVLASTTAQGEGGNIEINADTVELIGASTNGQFSSAVASETSGIDSSAKAGNVSLNTRILNIRDGGIVSTQTTNQGKGGDLTVTAKESLNINGIAPSTLPNNPFFISILTTSTQGFGEAGNLKVADTGIIKIEDGGAILASTFNQGEGGNIEINADTVELIGVSTNGQFRSAVASETSGIDSSAKAGNVSLNTRILNIRDGGIISTQTFNQGKGGDLTVTARESLNISEIAPSSLPEPNNQFFRSALVTTTVGSGSAGNINILDTGIIKIDDGGVISASTLNQGDGGNIEINADALEIIGVSPNGEFRNGLFSLTPGVDSFSTAGNGVFSITSGVDSSAKAGNITLNTQNLNLRDGAVLSTQSTNKGEAGNIIIQNDGRLQLNSSSILTNSRESSGGSININAKDIRLFDNSNIRTDVNTGTAGGGNITLTANTIIALEDSDILSFSADGKGGDINFNTAAFFSNPLYQPTPPISDRQTLNQLNRNEQVDVNASGAVSGTIAGVPDTTFIQNNLSELPDNQIDTNVLLASSCIIRDNQQNGTFFVTGAGGLPQNPSDAPLSNYSTGKVQSIPITSEKLRLSAARHSWKIGDPVIEPSGAYQLPNGQIVLSRECSK